MKENTDPIRNRPSEDRKDNDPNIRDESALRPGINTISSSETDDVDNHLTKTASDSFRTEVKDPKADKKFDEVGEGDNND